MSSRSTPGGGHDSKLPRMSRLTAISEMKTSIHDNWNRNSPVRLFSSFCRSCCDTSCSIDPCVIDITAQLKPSDPVTIAFQNPPPLQLLLLRFSPLPEFGEEVRGWG